MGAVAVMELTWCICGAFWSTGQGQMEGGGFTHRQRIWDYGEKDAIDIQARDLRTEKDLTC